MPSRVNVAADAKAQRAWLMRVAGAPWSVIAAQVGYHDDANAIRAVRTYAGSIPKPDRAASRELWRERLELLWSHARKDVAEGKTGALRAAVAVAQRAAALDALDEPTLAVMVSPSQQELSAVLDAMLTRSGHELPVEADVFALDDGDE